ncbi:MAG: hypothetical protein V3T32_08030 [Thermodesulfobacteriota bacterium]
MKYKVEKGKQITGWSKYPFDEMKPGDSFLIPVDDVNDRKQCLKVQTPLLGYAKKHGIKIVTRKRPKEKGIRVWMAEEEK